MIADPVIAATLRRIVDEARTAWPALEVSDELFTRALLDRVSMDAGNAATASALDELCTKDLYLVAGCLGRCRHALAVFDANHLGEVERAHRRIRPTGLDLDDARQLLRETFLVGTSTRPPKLTEYAGRGALKAWVRVVVVSTLVDAARSRTSLKKEISSDAVVDATAAATADPELQFLKAKYGHEFRAAVEESFAELPAKDRNLLRQHLVDSLTIDQIGELYGTHRATAARWIAAARERFFRQARKILARHMDLPEECVDLIESDVGGGFGVRGEF